MPRNPVTGDYTRPVNSFSQPSLGEVIDPVNADALWDDYDTALTDSLSRTGEGTMLADLDMGGFSITNFASPGISFAVVPDNNIISNGGMAVSQQWGTTAVTGIGGLVGDHVSIIDQWCIGYTNGSFVVSGQQVADAPPGLKYSLKLTVTTADAAMAPGDTIVFTSPIEGSYLSSLGLGATGASASVAFFWVKAHRTGDYSGSLKSGASDKSFCFSFTVSAADTWEYKTISIAAQTGGTWATDNTVAGYFSVCIASGTTLLSTAGWQTGNFDGVLGTTNGVAATSDTFQISGVGLVAGTQLPTAAQSVLMMRPFPIELQRCKRYWQASYDYGVAPGTVTRVGDDFFACTIATVTTIGARAAFQVPMVADPSIALFSPVTGAANKAYNLGSAADVDVAVRDTPGQNGFAWFASSFSTTNTQIVLHWVAYKRLLG